MNEINKLGKDIAISVLVLSESLSSYIELVKEIAATTNEKQTADLILAKVAKINEAMEHYDASKAN